ncbi:MAG: hypothetical protein LC808_02455 [Actinobacteria bacterium]|nr:hypothetical protein [Actinomycetota bacterium]
MLFQGPGRGRKGEFAFALADLIREGVGSSSPPVAPIQLAALFSYLHDDPLLADEETDGAATTD